MRVVLRQLPTLKKLTVSAYEKAGGALGLSAEYAAEIVNRVAIATDTTPNAVRRLLAELVNPHDPSKTRDLAEGEFDSDALKGDKLSRVLNQLKQEEMVRDRADETGARRWRLDHDYLAQAVDELERRESALLRLLKEQSEQLRHPSLWKKRSALLRPIELVRIDWDLLRGRLRLGDAWPVVAASSIFWLASLTVIVAGFYFSLRASLDDQADRYVSELGHTPEHIENPFFPGISNEEAKRWAQLAREPLLLRQLVERRMSAEKLMKLDSTRSGMAAAAFGGLSPLAPQQFRMTIACPGEDMDTCLFLASHFGQNAEAVAREFMRDPSSTDDHFLDLARFVPTDTLLGECPKGESICAYFGQIASANAKPHVPTEPEREKARAYALRVLEALVSNQIPPGEALLSSRLRLDVTDASLSARYVPRLLALFHQDPTQILVAPALSNLAPYMRADEAVRIGREMLDRTLADGNCIYGAGYVRAEDIPTALAALEYPACAASEGQDIQKAIADATTHVPAGDVDRWTFAREWVGPNASKYNYDPERYNTLSYLVRCEVRRFIASSLHPFLPRK